MGKDKHAPQAEETLRRYGFKVRAESARNIGNRFVAGEFDDEPDLFCIRGKSGIFVEIKTFKSAFPIASYRIGQRKWATEATESGHDVWLWFFGGDHPANYDETRHDKDNNLYRPRKAWLIPYSIVRTVLERFEDEDLQKSIPYGRKKKMNPTIRKENLTFTGIFKAYELNYKKGGVWGLYQEHPFATEYLSELIPNMDYIHDRRFAISDKIFVEGYSEEYEIADYGEYDIHHKCWQYSIKSWENEMQFSGVLENTMRISLRR